MPNPHRGVGPRSGAAVVREEDDLFSSGSDLTGWGRPSGRREVGHAGGWTAQVRPSSSVRVGLHHGRIQAVQDPSEDLRSYLVELLAGGEH